MSTSTSVCPSVHGSRSVRPKTIFNSSQLIIKISLIKVVWYVLGVKNMHPGSSSDLSGIAATEAKPRCMYSILKPHGQSFITSPESVQSSCVHQHTQDVPAQRVLPSNHSKFTKTFWCFVQKISAKLQNIFLCKICIHLYVISKEK